MPMKLPFLKSTYRPAVPFPRSQRRNMIPALEPLKKHIVARALPAVTTAQAAHFVVVVFFLYADGLKKLLLTEGWLLRKL